MYGWCFDPDEGLCSPNSPREKCNQEGGEWDEEWNAGKCNEGCCVAGRNTQFVTQTRCEKVIGGEVDWSISEIDCEYYSLKEQTMEMR